MEHFEDQTFILNNQLRQKINEVFSPTVVTQEEFTHHYHHMQPGVASRSPMDGNRPSVAAQEEQSYRSHSIPSPQQAKEVPQAHYRVPHIASVHIKLTRTAGSFTSVQQSALEVLLAGQARVQPDNMAFLMATLSTEILDELMQEIMWRISSDIMAEARLESIFEAGRIRALTPEEQISLNRELGDAAGFVVQNVAPPRPAGERAQQLRSDDGLAAALQTLVEGQRGVPKTPLTGKVAALQQLVDEYVAKHHLAPWTKLLPTCSVFVWP
jgi:hypothetical protein